MTVPSPTIATITTTATSTVIATSPTIATSTTTATSLSTHIEWGTVCLKNKIYISHAETYLIVSFLCKCPPLNFNHSRARGVIYIYMYYLVITYCICRCHRKGDSYQFFYEISVIIVDSNQPLSPGALLLTWFNLNPSMYTQWGIKLLNHSTSSTAQLLDFGNG